ncbi:MAG: tetratricopeptide repeat protein [Chloracidobacterium sp.]|nr:tetratricopeptide repeat protein [Chloracidobacterium sp.]MDW8216420.1 tetratricopeptide repeat protein [Acidobacteriota bacterium]
MPVTRIAILLSGCLVAAGSVTTPALPQQPSPKPRAEKPHSPPPAKASRDQRIKAYEKFLQARRYVAQADPLNAIAAFKEVLALDPKAAAAHVELGNLYLEARNLRDAEQHARQAVALDPEDATAHWLLGRLLYSQALGATFNREKAREAVAALETVAKLDSLNLDVYRLLGRLYRDLNEVDNALSAYAKLIGANQGGPEEFDAATELYFRKRRYRDAANTARQAYVLSGENPQWGYRLAQALLYAGQTAEAIEVLRELLEENGNNLRLTLSYAEALMRGGRYADAEQQVQRILSVHPNHPEALSILAQVQRRSGRREEAVKTLQQALAGQDVTETLAQQYALAETLAELGRIEEAVAAYESALRSVVNPDNSVSESQRERAELILMRIAATYKAAGRNDKEIATYDRMRRMLGAESALADMLEIESLRSEGRHEEALKAARAARRRFPQERQFVYLEAQVLSRLGQVDQALKELKKVAEEVDDAGEIAQMKAIILSDANRFEDAEQSARQAVRYDEKNIAYLVTLSSILERRKQYAESEQLLRTVLSLDPDNPTALNNLGYFLAERNERLDEALALVQRAVNIEPTNSSFLDSLGWVYFKQNRLDLAKYYIEQALGYDRRNATLNDHLGDVLERMGDLEGARRQWKIARSLATDPEEIHRIEAKLQRGQTAETQ